MPCIPRPIPTINTNKAGGGGVGNGSAEKGQGGKTTHLPKGKFGPHDIKIGSFSPWVQHVWECQSPPRREVLLQVPSSELMVACRRSRTSSFISFLHPSGQHWDKIPGIQAPQVYTRLVCTRLGSVGPPGEGGGGPGPWFG